MNELDASCAMLFISLLGLLVLCIFRFTRTRRFTSLLLPGMILCVMIPVLAYFASFRMPANAGREPVVPFFVIQPAALLILIPSVAGISGEYRKWKNDITPRSIRQALDHLNMGICFTDSSGDIILMNYFFTQAVLSLGGSYPRSIGDIRKALDIRENGGEMLCRLPDGRILSFREDQLTEPGLEGVVRILLHDVTEYSEMNRSLQESNEQLRKSNEEIRSLIDRLSDMIREQETLNLKMKVHNEMGTALIAISGLRNDPDEKSTGERLSLLENAVRWFAGERTGAGRTMEDVRRQSVTTGVRLSIDGEIPDGAEELISAAISECMTNCVRHAGGDMVSVRITRSDGTIRAEITDNGTPPAGEIREGGGLSALRRRIEQCSGEMHIQSTPVFVLTITLNLNYETQAVR